MVTDEGTGMFTVNCTATGIPAPNITWRDPNGVDIPNNNNNRIMVENTTMPQLLADDGFTFLYHATRTLVISNPRDSDIGIYTCVADNGVASVDSNAVEVFVRGTYVSMFVMYIRMYKSTSTWDKAAGWFPSSS